MNEMTGWPEEIFVGLDSPRPLSDGLRLRLQDSLLGETRPLDDLLTERLQGTLEDPLSAMLEGIDAPRPLPRRLQLEMQSRLGRQQGGRRARWLSVAALVILVAGSFIAFGTGGQGHPTDGTRALRNFGTGADAGAGAAGGSASGTAPGGALLPGSAGPGLHDASGSTGGALGFGGSAMASGPSSAGPAGPNHLSATQGQAGIACTSSPTNPPAPPAASGQPAGSTASSTGRTCPAPPGIYSIDPNAGPQMGGTKVDITGNGLSGAKSVAFGSAPAQSMEVVSDTEIKAVAPPSSQAGSVDLTVAVGNAKYTLSKGFTYDAVPTVSSVSPLVGPPGTKVTIGGTSFAGAMAVYFGGTAATSFAVQSNGQLVAVAPSHGGGPVDVTVTTPGGTSATDTSDVFTYSP